MSEIHGQGYGDQHNWKRGYTRQFENGEIQSYMDKSTAWHCEDCGASFNHNYDVIPDIFEAIKVAGIPENCVKKEIS